MLLRVSWEDDDHEAIVMIMPADAKPENEDKPFETFTLPIPRHIRRMR